MSKIAVSPNASGTGTYTLASPNNNASHTITLPVATGELLVNTSTGVSVTGNVSLTGELDMNNNDIVGVDNIYHEGDSNTYIGFHAADQFRVVAGGNESLEVRSGVVNVDMLEVGGTDVISSSRQLQNIASIDATTAAAITAAGVGAGGYNWSTATTSANSVKTDGTSFIQHAGSGNFNYSANGTSWTSFSKSIQSASNFLSFTVPATSTTYYVIWVNRYMYITTDPSSSGTWTYRALYGGFGGPQCMTMTWGTDRSNNTISSSSPRLHVGHGWNGSYGTWGTSFSDDLGASWSAGTAQSSGNFNTNYTYSPASGRGHMNNAPFTWKTGSQSWNGSNPSFSTTSIVGIEATQNGSFVKANGSSADIYKYSAELRSLPHNSTSSSSFGQMPSGATNVVWDSTNSQYICAASNFLYTSTDGNTWTANFSPTGGAAISGLSISSTHLCVSGNGATFISEI